MPKIVNTALKAKATGPEAKAKAIKFGLEAPRGQGLASRTTSLSIPHSKISSDAVGCNSKAILAADVMCDSWVSTTTHFIRLGDKIFFYQILVGAF